MELRCGKLFKLGVVCVLIYDKSEGTFMLEYVSQLFRIFLKVFNLVIDPKLITFYLSLGGKTLQKKLIFLKI